MIMCRELSEDEIEKIEVEVMSGYWDSNEVWQERLPALRFARALFEAARVQQTTERLDEVR